MEKYKILKSQLIQLGLKNMADNFYKEAERSRKAGLDYLDYLSELISREIHDKLEKSINYRIRNARFPMFKTIEQFDFSFQTTLNQKEILELMELEFVNQKENIIFIGPPGVGKTHLSIAIGVEACKKRVRNIFYSANELINQLRIAKVSNKLPDFLERLTRYSIVIVDELGYMPLTSEDANLFFQFVNQKYEKSSVILSTNSNFGDWGKIFKDDVVAAAIIDRLVHHSHIIRITGDSYRIKDKKIDNA